MNPATESLRKDALSLFQAGVDAADPYQAVTKCLTVGENHIEIALDPNDNTQKRVGRWQKIRVIAFGKAACSMAQAARDIIPEHRLADNPIALTNYENAVKLKGINVLTASHPLPDAAGQKAARYIAETIKKADPDELLSILISGGGSALLPYPADGITLEDKISTTGLLLASGADINQINCVRKHLSGLKGGQLARIAAANDMHALILSDVLGDDLSSIASGPTVADDTSFKDAIRILKSKHVWDKTPLSVQKLLENGVQGNISETPKENDPCFKNCSQSLIGSNRISLDAVAKNARERGYNTLIFSQSLSGEAREAADQIACYGKKLQQSGLLQPTAILAGGETTVTLTGSGSGGRNQEMALAFALSAKKHRLNAAWTFLSAGTDGRDGPTDAAGGMVDADTINRIKQGGTNPEDSLHNNDSYPALKKSEDLVMTGATGTNVADLQVLLIQPE